MKKQLGCKLVETVEEPLWLQKRKKRKKFHRKMCAEFQSRSNENLWKARISTGNEKL